MASPVQGVNSRYGLTGSPDVGAQRTRLRPGRRQNQRQTARIANSSPWSVGSAAQAERAGANYGPLRSLISTDAPLTGSQTRAIARVPQVYRGGGSSGNASRDAYARSMADASSNQLAGTMDRYQQEYRKRAEDARSKDLTTQAQLRNAGFQTERERQTVTRQQDLQRDQTLAEIKQFRKMAGQDARAARRNSLIGGIIGTSLIGATAPFLAPALAGGATFGIGGAAAGGGLMAGLLSGGRS